MRIPLWRKLLFAGMATLLALLILELLLRGISVVGIVELPGQETVRDAWAKGGWRVDRDLNWALIPMNTSIRGGVACTTNSHGLRDQEIPLKKPRGTYRILALGDSTVLGFGVPLEKTFSERLETLLNENRAGVPFQVINAGVPGYSIYNCLTYLKRDGIRFDPDLVILETNFNDRRYIPSPEYEDGEEFYHGFYRRLRLRETVEHSYLYRALRRLLVGTSDGHGKDLVGTGDFDYERLDLEGVRCRIEPDRYRRLLGELIDYLEQKEIPLVLVPLEDPPFYVADYYTACSLAEAGRYEEAVRILGEFSKLPFYGVVAARKFNELADRVGRQGMKIKSVPNRVKWMSTDGNLPVYLSDPYKKVMLDAAARDGVVTIDFDPAPPGYDQIYLDYIHLNEDGHRLLAEQLHATLMRSEELGFPLPGPPGRTTP